MESVKAGCANYFRGFQELGKIKDNSPKETIIAVFKVLSYTTVLIPLGVGIMYGISDRTLKGRIKKQTKLPGQSRTNGIRDQKLGGAVGARKTNAPPISLNGQHVNQAEKQNQSSKAGDSRNIAPKTVDVEKNKKAEDLFDAANNCYENHQLDEAVKLYKEAVKLGSLEAATQLGYMYYSGSGVPKDHTQALKFYSKNPDSKAPVPQLQLGLLHLNNLNDPDHKAKAERHLRIAAEAGETEAQVHLGDLYWRGVGKGLGLGVNYPEALKWYTKAAEKGNADALFSLSFIYSRTDRGAEKNLDLSRDYLIKAADADSTKAQYNLGKAYLGKPFFLGPKNDGHKLIDKNSTKGMYYLTRAADHDDGEAQVLLAEIFFNGEEDGISKDVPRAIKYFENAAENGNLRALDYLGSIYLNGNGTKKDTIKAVEYLEKAAKQGSEYAINELAKINLQPS